MAAAHGRHGAGEAADERGCEPEDHITIYTNDSSPNPDIAVAIQASWKELGITAKIKQMEFPQFLEFLGPPPNADVDVYRLGWIGDFVDAINFLDLWTCESGNNNTNFCNKDFDAVSRRRRTPRTTTPATSCTGRRKTSWAARTARCRSYRSTGTRTRTSSGVHQGDVQRQPAQPDRPDEGRRHRVGTRITSEDGAKRPRPCSAILATRVGRLDAEVHRQAHLLDDPGAPRRDLPDLHA